MRSGVEHVTLGAHVHCGRDAYLQTRALRRDGGVEFGAVVVSDHTSLGQRVVLESGAAVGEKCTVGAEAWI